MRTLSKGLEQGLQTEHLLAARKVMRSHSLREIEQVAESEKRRVGLPLVEPMCFVFPGLNELAQQTR
jgi:radical SAM superfamily enzyme